MTSEPAEGRAMVREPGDVVMHPDLPYHVCGPYVVQSTMSPTGLSVRLTVGNVGPAAIERLHLEVRSASGKLTRLLPGNDGGRPVDLTRIRSGGYLWLNVEPLDETGRLAQFDVALDAPATGAWGVEGVVPLSGERYR
jgi:hypothetical protein